MGYSTMMVQLDLEQSNDARLKIAGELAEQFDAKLIGIAAREPYRAYAADFLWAQSLLDQQRASIEKELAETEERFRSAMGKRVRAIEWRGALAAPTDYVTREARAADLVIVGSVREDGLLDPLRQFDPGDLLMQVGRPVFVVPPEAESLRLKSALVAWKDTREARRAVLDAIPLLKRVKEVNVLEIVEDETERAAARHRVDDVAAWLGGHGIAAFSVVTHARGEVDLLDAIWNEGADIVVAGAYGHTRLREWVLGGVTRNLLTRTRRCSLLAH
jgi:nucleotide-binding universal stress UspA family protein